MQFFFSYRIRSMDNILCNTIEISRLRVLFDLPINDEREAASVTFILFTFLKTIDSII